jgi:hypothetical protein
MPCRSMCCPASSQWTSFVPVARAYSSPASTGAVRLDLAVHDEQQGGTQERSRAQGIEGHRGVQRPAGDPVLPIR